MYVGVCLFFIHACSFSASCRAFLTFSFFFFFFFFCIRFWFYVFFPPFCLLASFFSILKTFSKGKKKTQRHDDNYDASRQVALKLTTEENKSK